MSARPTATVSQSAMRVVLRTSRTEWRRRPSSAAASGASAIRPVELHTSSEKAAMPSVEAASCAAPSRATNITSTAWIAICSRFAPTSGRASRSVAENSTRKGEGWAMSVMQQAGICKGGNTGK